MRHGADLLDQVVESFVFVVTWSRLRIPAGVTLFLARDGAVPPLRQRPRTRRSVWFAFHL
jgi:hypothetical protein